MDYGVIISFERSMFYINVLSAKILNKKSAVYIQNPLLLSLKQIYGQGIIFKIHVFLHQVLFLHTDKIVAVSKGIKKDLINTFSIDKKKIAVIQPFINTERINELKKEHLTRKENVIFKDKKVIINIGRLHPQKNQYLLIKAFSRALKKIHDLFLIIIGEGEEREKLERLIQNLKLKNKICLLGLKNNPFKYLARSHLFILSSDFEGFPYVLQESIYCSVPILAFDCPAGPREIMCNRKINIWKYGNYYKCQYGLLVNNDVPNKEKSLSKGIYDFFHNKNNSYSRDRKRQTLFSFEKTFIKWYRLINRIMI